MKLTIVLLLCIPACAQTWFSKVTKHPATNSCTVDWTTAVPTVGHVNYGLATGAYTSHTQTSGTYSTTNKATISGLSAGTTYYLRIVATDVSDDWIRSLEFTCKTAAAHSVKLNWKASTSSGVTGYEVYRSTISGGYYAMLDRVGGLTYTDDRVQSSTTYYYVTRAINGAGEQSKFSNQVQVVIP